VSKGNHWYSFVLWYNTKRKHRRTVWKFELFLFIGDEVSLVNPMHFLSLVVRKWFFIKALSRNWWFLLFYVQHINMLHQKGCLIVWDLDPMLGLISLAPPLTTGDSTCQWSHYSCTFFHRGGGVFCTSDTLRLRYRSWPKKFDVFEFDERFQSSIYPPCSVKYIGFVEKLMLLVKLVCLLYCFS